MDGEVGMGKTSSGVVIKIGEVQTRHKDGSSLEMILLPFYLT